VNGPHGRRRRHRGRHRLRRVLVAWFGLAILATGVTVGAVMHVAGGTPAWHDTWRKVEVLAAHQFADVWHDPERRDALARRIADDLGVGVALEDVQGRTLLVHGPACRAGEVDVEVADERGTLGRVRACWPAPRGRGGLVLGLVVAGLTLWGAAGLLARRILRPVDRLVDFAGRLGTGELSARLPVERERGELFAVAGAMNDMAARLEKQLGESRALLGAVSHEVRTPLAHLRVLVELLADRGGDPALVADLEREIADLDALMGKLLAGSRLDLSALDRKRLRVRDVIDRALAQVGAAGVVVDADADDAEVDGDATLLVRALANLVENANVHGGGAERVRVRVHDGHVEIALEDRGPGLDEHALAHAFEPRWRGRTAAAGNHAALGLGLSLVERIAAAHGGSVYAENRPSGGARIGVRLPRAG
jgi:signal transduction histidine kinase